MHRISIIITFFNETAYLKMAVASVLSQSIDDLELVIVNDNPSQFGPDYFKSLNFSPSVNVLHHAENKGLSAARNTGIAATTGAIVGFLDADDYYTSSGLANQLALAEQSGADITHAGCYLSRPGSPELDILRRDKLLFDTPKSGAGLIHLEEAQFITSSWSSLYRRDFLDAHNLRFDVEQPKFEDRIFVLQSVISAGKIATLGKSTRVWRQRAGSISVSPSNPFIHRLQVQLLEKCLGYVQQAVATGKLPFRFEKRELFNTVSRLIWDMDIIDPIVAKADPIYAELAQRIVALLGDARFGMAIFDDPILSPISRVGMRTRKGFITRVMFFDLHKALREGDFELVQKLLKKTVESAAYNIRPKEKQIDADVFLHLGMHKTGSTYLQHHLNYHRDALLRAGIFVPGKQYQSTTDETIRDGALSGHSKLVSGLRETQKSTAWRDLRAEVEQSGAKTVVISCENMLFPMSGDRTEMLAKLMNELAMFRSFRAVAFVRRPDTFVESFYKEIVSNGKRMGSRSLQEFVVDYADTLTDLPSLFGPFEAVCDTPVILSDFDAAIAKDRLWATFCELCHFPSDLAAQPAPTYPSAGRNGTKAAQLVNTLISDRRQRQRMLRDLFQALPQELGQLSILSPSERLDLIDRFMSRSEEFAASRGYAPSYAKMRKSIAKNWTPAEGMDEATFTALLQSRLRAELPLAAQEAETGAENAAVHPRPKDQKQLVLRIKPRPWVVSMLKWRPFR